MADAFISRLRERATMSPMDKDSPVFLSVAKKLEDSEKVKAELDGEIDLLRQTIEQREAAIESLRDDIAELKGMITAAHTDRDRVIMAMMKAPTLEQTFSLIELSEFCSQQHEWQQGARREILEEVNVK